jgi:hypothetical protein
MGQTPQSARGRFASTRRPTCMMLEVAFWQSAVNWPWFRQVDAEEFAGKLSTRRRAPACSCSFQRLGDDDRRQPRTSSHRSMVLNDLEADAQRLVELGATRYSDPAAAGWSLRDPTGLVILHI